MYYYGPMMDGYGWGWGVVGSLVWLAFFVFIAFLGYRLLKSRSADLGSKSDPLDLAKERYAKGEIDKQQFEQLKKDLTDK